MCETEKKLDNKCNLKLFMTWPSVDNITLYISICGVMCQYCFIKHHHQVYAMTLLSGLFSTHYRPKYKAYIIYNLITTVLVLYIRLCIF